MVRFWNILKAEPVGFADELDEWSGAGFVTKPMWLHGDPLGNRLNQELKLISKCGLWNKCEVWRVNLTLAKIHKAA